MRTEVMRSNNGLIKTKYFNYYATVALYALLLLPFMSLAGVNRLVGSEMLPVYQSAAALVLFALVVFKVRFVRIDRFAWLYLLFIAVVNISTVLHFSFSMGIFTTYMVGFFIILLLQWDTEIILKALTLIGVVAIVLNLITVLQHGISAHTSYFIGGKNSFSIFLIPTAMVMIANDYLHKQKVSKLTVVWIALALLMTVLAGSATGFVTVATMIAALLWIRKKKVNIALAIGVMILAQLALVLLLDILSGLPLWMKILNLLGKDETLTSRAMIWDGAIEIIKDNWLIGVGRGAKIHYISSWGGARVVSEAHNFILELLLESGVLGFGLYMFMLREAIRKANNGDVLHRVIFTGFFLILTNGMAESCNNKMFVSIYLGLMNACATGRLSMKNISLKK